MRRAGRRELGSTFHSSTTDETGTRPSSRGRTLRAGSATGTQCARCRASHRRRGAGPLRASVLVWKYPAAGVPIPSTGRRLDHLSRPRLDGADRSPWRTRQIGHRLSDPRPGRAAHDHAPPLDGGEPVGPPDGWWCTALTARQSGLRSLVSMYRFARAMSCRFRVQRLMRMICRERRAMAIASTAPTADSRRAGA